MIAHEYGHFVLDQLDQFQQGFGEGFADTLAILLFDDSILGQDFLGSGIHARDIGTSDIHFPCAGLEAHCCGQALARMWWDVRTYMTTELSDSAIALEFARELFTSWALMTLGADFVFLESIEPHMAIEVLVLDDDDGDLGNGTPNGCVLCTSLGGRSIPCPSPYDDADQDWIPDSCACITAADCGDVDSDGITDDNCKWYSCGLTINGVCHSRDRRFADGGGAFGDCVPDGFCNIADALHAMNCFSGASTCDDINADYGGAFGVPVAEWPSQHAELRRFPFVVPIQPTQPALLKLIPRPSKLAWHTPDPLALHEIGTSNSARSA